MKKWTLVGIIALAFVLRIIGLASHPVGFTPDEASFGYDAYSILKTGKDQWGQVLPLVFKSFGDDKLPVYTYLAIPSVAILGLSEFTTRLPNAILGSLAIFVTYLFVRKLFDNEKVALLSGFLLAISPWHVMLSRGAFEANLTTFFLPLGVLFFLKSFKNTKYLWLSYLVLLINIFTYHTARILTPAILIFLIFNYRKELKANNNLNVSFILSIVILGISLAGFIFGGSRVASSSIFGLGFADDRYFAQVAGEPNFVSKIFYNKPIYVVKLFLQNYLSYFSPQFLFSNGPNEGTYGMVPGVGMLYLIEAVFLCGFVIKLIRDGIKKEYLLLIFWILLSPIPAALTKGPGLAANRAAFMIPGLQIICALGAVYLLMQLKNKNIKKYFVMGSFILLFFNFIYVGERYIVWQRVNGASSMIYGTKKVVEETNNLEGSTVVSKNISEPQIYFAFYTRMDPSDYQNSSKNWTLVNGWVDQQGEYSLGRYTFRNINYSVDSKLKNTVLVGTPSDFPAEIKPDFSINYPNGKPAYYIVR